LDIVFFQIWAKGTKPENAPETDFECTESSWGIGANITTKLLNAAGEVNYQNALLK
jgi:hypothetical protein